MGIKRKKNLVKDTKRLITPALVFHTDIVVKKARGIYVESAGGKRYMDFTSGLATTNLGHCPPPVVAAAKRQLERFIHSGCIFRYDSVIELAQRLREKTPEGIEMFFFSNSGAEAVEGAIKLARFYTKRQGVIAFTGGFHGRTLGALTLTASSARYRRNYHPLLPSVFHAPYPYCYRCPVGNRPESCSTECFGFLEWTLEHLITPEEVACVVIEPVLGEGGYAPAPLKYLKKLRELSARHGILFVADEVQTGFGRTGRWFACEHYGIKPDIMVMAKAIASGLPLSAVGSTRKIMERWSPGAHGTTFGGNPVSCAAACATIDAIEKMGAVENARKVGEYALGRLTALKGRCRQIGDVRGLGLMLGVEFVKEDKTPDAEVLKNVLRGCEDRGVIMVECGKYKNIARFMPPLTVKKGEMEKALDIFEESIVRQRKTD
ncbi:MAG: aspartate aminotransferase family protein [Deltaproteobacteria bacterium]|nr:aspartate aminotransferase family protein [Deltaproteobacteria bacterium]